ncbi:MAG TPA: ABC transporter permease [Acidimicrobiales bacterium]|nr:ABC transporter permease [Acidimicrobiales bacterium]
MNIGAAIRRRTNRGKAESWRPRWLWASLTLPGGAWLLLLFVVPFYAVLAAAGGTLDPFFQSPVPVWDPLHWTASNYTAVWHDIFGSGAYIDGPVVRTAVYTAIASVLSLVIAYPVAYFVTRFAGRRKTLFLALLVAPFWVSYMMRMLAWIDLLQTDGYVNRILSDLHITSHPVNWLGGDAVTVIFGLVYGYIPYLIVVLYAGLDRIDGSLLEASRDLGLGKWRTFWRVTVPLSRQTILAGMFITVLPMIGDYFTNQLLSGTPGTTMVGNVIEGQLQATGEAGQGAALSIGLLVILLVPMIYYVVSTARASRENI